jgi:hypothetical protein
VPKVTYGLDIFNKITDIDARQSLMAMVAASVDTIQDMANYTEEKLGNPLPYNDKQHIACFSKFFADGIGAKQS